MSKILIIGNVLKDVYLKLNERSEPLEEDQNGIKWLNLGFDGSTHEFFNRASIYSGAAITLEILKNFGLSAEIHARPVDLPVTNRRYIFAVDDQTSYFTSNQKPTTAFNPAEIEDDVAWLFVDRSATLSENLVQNLLKTLNARKNLKLAFYIPKHPNRLADPLIKKASVIFTENLSSNYTTSGIICQISERSLKLNNATLPLKKLEKTDFFTPLTLHSIFAATVLAALLTHKSPEDALTLAKLNLENTKLDTTLSLEKLEALLAETKASTVNLRQMAKQLVAPGKGILAADESGGSIHKKFESMHIPDDFQHRRDYRNLFFTTPGLENYVNGVILFDETARQTADDGRDFVKFLTSKGIIPGIKVDKGLVNLPGSTEKYTLGLNGLDERLKEYFAMGLRFAKWRAAFEISRETPTKPAVYKNVEILASYAKKCQEANIVPIIEPEVVFDGDYPIEHCAGITGIILKELFAELERQDVDLGATLLKVNMILAGKQFATQSTPKEVGLWTARTLKHFIPESLAGVVFLSGGQTPEQATANLQAVINNGPFPWPVAFSYARALQGPALEAWKGDNQNYPEAQAAFLERLKANCAALHKTT